MRKKSLFAAVLSACILTSSVPVIPVYGAEFGMEAGEEAFGDGGFVEVPEEDFCEEEIELFSSETVPEEEKSAFSDTPVVEEYLGKEGFLQEGGLLDPELVALAATIDPKKKKEVKRHMEASLYNFSKDINLSEYKLTSDEFHAIMQELINDMGGFYHVGLGNSTVNYVLNVKEDSEEHVENFEPYYRYDKKTYHSMADKYNNVIEEFLSGVDPSWSELEKALYAHDYLVMNCQYGMVDEMAFTAYGALVDQYAVCQGFTMAYCELMDVLGIECQSVTCWDMMHAWNLVKINSKWYYVDTTFDNPINFTPEANCYDYFLKSDEFFKEEYDGEFIFSGGGYKGIAKDKTYDTYFWEKNSSASCYYDGYWYANIGGKINQYQTDGKNFTFVKSIRDVPWREYIDALGIFGSKLYFANKTDVLSYDLKTGKEEIAHPLTAEEKQAGEIYCMKITRDGKLILGIVPKVWDGTYKRGSFKIHDHNYVSEVTKKASCGGPGITTYTCTTCGRYYTKSTAATGKHKYGGWKVVKKADCIHKGLEKRYCSGCGYYQKKEIACTECNWKVKKVLSKATLKANGWYIKECPVCGSGSYEIAFYPKTVSLSKSSFVYNGKVQKPKVKVKDCTGKVIPSSNYTVTYSSGCKKPGTYKVTITFKGKLYSGKMSKTFKIVKK